MIMIMINKIFKHQVKMLNLNKMSLYSVHHLYVSTVFQKLSFRYYQSESLINKSNNDIEEQNIKNSEDLNNNYNISWTKDYKNLNNLLGIKGLNSNELIDINKINYLVFSLTNEKYSLSNNIIGGTFSSASGGWRERDIFYSLTLVTRSKFINNKEQSNWLYEKIIYNLKNNSSLIKEGGILEIYYVTSSKLDNNIKEGYRNIYKDSKSLIASINELIRLNGVINNNTLEVKIYIFSYDTFFNEYLTSHETSFFSTKLVRDINSKLWAFPILIIEDMNLPTVTYLFKERGINIHGMSTTRRHKLSPLEKNLSNFLYFTDLDDTIQNTHLQFIDEIFTNNKIDHDLYKNISKVQEYNLVKRLKIIEEIRDIDNEVEDSNNIEKTKIYLIQKLKNLENNSMSPIVLILILRNYIFELEKLKNEKEGKHNDLLLLYKKIKTEVEELITTDENNEIIKKLNTKVKNLNLEISTLDNIVNTKQEEVNNNKLINQANKIQMKAAKTKKQKKTT